MGLDITALRQATFISADTDLDWEKNQTYFSPMTEQYEKADGLNLGVYEGTEIFSFRAGSYSGYNRWREWLSLTILGVKPEEIWDNPEQFKDKPFVELINFTDCDGGIGPITSAKLYKDFKENRDKAIAGSNIFDGDYFVQKYDEFTHAFELASDSGLVSFSLAPSFLN